MINSFGNFKISQENQYHVLHSFFLLRHTMQKEFLFTLLLSCLPTFLLKNSFVIEIMKRKDRVTFVIAIGKKF